MKIALTVINSHGSVSKEKRFECEVNNLSYMMGGEDPILEAFNTLTKAYLSNKEMEYPLQTITPPKL